MTYWAVYALQKKVHLHIGVCGLERGRKTCFWILSVSVTLCLGIIIQVFMVTIDVTQDQALQLLKI